MYPQQQGLTLGLTIETFVLYFSIERPLLKVLKDDAKVDHPL